MGVGAGLYVYVVVVKVHVRYLSYIEYLMHRIVSNNKLKVGMDWAGPRLEVGVIYSWYSPKMIDMLCIN